MQGTGICTFPDGSIYEGEMHDDHKNGKGTFTDTEGIKFTGNFVDGYRDPNGAGVETLPDGEVYEGEFKDSKRNGKGVCTYPSGQKYEGDWEDG